MAGVQSPHHSWWISAGCSQTVLDEQAPEDFSYQFFRSIHGGSWMIQHLEQAACTEHPIIG